jgi:hypothetical protein
VGLNGSVQFFLKVKGRAAFSTREDNSLLEVAVCNRVTSTGFQSYVR